MTDFFIENNPQEEGASLVLKRWQMGNRPNVELGEEEVQEEVKEVERITEIQAEFHQEVVQ